MRHDEIRSMLAGFLSGVYHDVRQEPTLHSVDTEVFA